MLSGNMKEAYENRVKIEETKFEIFSKIIEFIYTDEIQLDDIDTVIALLIEANKFSLPRLKTICESYLS